MSLLSDDDISKIILYGEEAFPYLQMLGRGSEIEESISWDIVYYLRTITVDKGPIKTPSPQERAERFKEPLEKRKDILHSLLLTLSWHIGRWKGICRKRVSE